jgi:hypothetical protein
MMPYRLLGYVNRIWERCLKQHPGKTRLPPVVPVVLHQGASRWSGPTELFQMMEGDLAVLDALKVFLPNFRFLIDDLGATTDEQLRQRAELGALCKLILLVLKHSRDSQVRKALGEVSDLIDDALALPIGLEAVDVAFRYLLETTELEADQIREELVPKLGLKIEEVIMTGAQKLIETGIEKGIDKGRKLEATELLLLFLSKRFGAVPPAVNSRVKDATFPQLSTWLERAFTASALTEIFEQ